MASIAALFGWMFVIVLAGSASVLLICGIVALIKITKEFWEKK